MSINSSFCNDHNVETGALTAALWGGNDTCMQTYFIYTGQDSSVLLNVDTLYNSLGFE